MNFKNIQQNCYQTRCGN